MLRRPRSCWRPRPTAARSRPSARASPCTTCASLGRAAHAGLEPEAGVNATVELAHQALAVAALGRTDAGTTVTPTASRAGTTTNTVPAEGSFSVDVRVRGPRPSRTRATRHAVAARRAAGCRARGHRRAEPAPARGTVLGGAVRAGLGARRTPRPAAAHHRRPSAVRRTATSPPASARPRSTAWAPSAAGRTPTTSTCSSTSSPAAPPCSLPWSRTCWRNRRADLTRLVRHDHDEPGQAEQHGMPRPT